MSCGVGRRHGLDSALLWLWDRSAAVAPIRPLTWEPPYAAGAALKRKEKKKKKKKAKKMKKEKQAFKKQNKVPFPGTAQARGYRDG